MKGTAPLPPAIAGEDEVLAEFVRRVAGRGGGKAMAEASGFCEAHISHVRIGRKPMTPRLAGALGFRLRYERIEAVGQSGILAEGRAPRERKG